MSLNAAALKIMQEKGLTLDDVVEIATAMEVRSKAADRQASYRERKKRTRDVTRDVTPPLNDSISNPPEPISAIAEITPFAEKVGDAWNGMAKANALDTVRKVAGARLKHVMARKRDHGEDAAFEAIRKLGESDWHCGRVNGWKANFNWLFGSPANFEKILERSDDAAASVDPSKWTPERMAQYAKEADTPDDAATRAFRARGLSECLPRQLREAQARMQS